MTTFTDSEVTGLRRCGDCAALIEDGDVWLHEHWHDEGISFTDEDKVEMKQAVDEIVQAALAKTARTMRWAGPVIVIDPNTPTGTEPGRKD